MDLTAAKGVLNRVAEQYKAAKDLGDALEIMVDLERQQNTLNNNVEHLQKEQVVQQKNLDAMAEEFQERYKQGLNDHAVRMSALKADRDALAAKIQAEKDAAEKAMAAERDRYEAFAKAHNDRMETLTAERQKTESYIADLLQEADNIKSKMRQFVS